MEIDIYLLAIEIGMFIRIGEMQNFLYSLTILDFHFNLTIHTTIPNASLALEPHYCPYNTQSVGVVASGQFGRWSSRGCAGGKLPDWRVG